MFVPVFNRSFCAIGKFQVKTIRKNPNKNQNETHCKYKTTNVWKTLKSKGTSKKHTQYDQPFPMLFYWIMSNFILMQQFQWWINWRRSVWAWMNTRKKQPIRAIVFAKFSSKNSKNITRSIEHLYIHPFVLFSCVSVCQCGWCFCCGCCSLF